MQFAVIIPAYNCAPYLKQCIDSVVSQTHAAAEVVVVDDGSRDNTREIAESYGPAVRYVRQANAGVSAARNRGVSVTKSPWLAFLDADDWWEPRKLEVQARAIEAHPEAVLCYTGMIIKGPGWDRTGDAWPADRLWPAMRYCNPIGTSSVAVRRDVFEEAGGFDSRVAASQDWDLWFRLGQRPAVAVAEPLTMYRVTPDSLSSDVDRMLRDARTMLENTLLRGLTGRRRWMWRQRAWSAELARCAITARDAESPRALRLLLRSLVNWPSPFFMPRRWKSLAAYILRPAKGGRSEQVGEPSES